MPPPLIAMVTFPDVQILDVTGPRTFQRRLDITPGSHRHHFGEATSG